MSYMKAEIRFSQVYCNLLVPFLLFELLAGLVLYFIFVFVSNLFVIRRCM